MRVVADTNIFLSALLFGGPPEAIIDSARQGQIDLLVSADILLELAAVLKVKFEWQDPAIADVVRSIGYFSTLVKPQVAVKEVTDDADNRVLECAVESNADFIVSGDHHLLDLKSYRGIRILKARIMLDIISES